MAFRDDNEEYTNIYENEVNRTIYVKNPEVLTEEVVNDWMTASEERGLPMFAQMDQLLSELSRSQPIRVWLFKRDLKWVRKEALKRNYFWGQQ